MFGKLGTNYKKRMQNYGQVKKESFDFERIASFFLSKERSEYYQLISDSTWNDLDFDEVFMYVDRTVSKVGQQYLYDTLRTIPKDGKRTTRVEKIIHFLNEDSPAKESIVAEVSRLNKPAAYFLKSLFLGTYIQKPQWFWVVPVLSSLSAITAVLTFKFSVFLWVLVPLLGINFIVHYWNKNNMMHYANAIPQLLILNQVTKKILRLGTPLNDYKDVKSAVTTLNGIDRKALIFKIEAKMERQLNSELGQIVSFLLETIKALFLVEPLLLFSILSVLENKKSDIRTVFYAVGEVDTALSIDAFRKSLPYFTVPTLTGPQKSLYGKDLYHPLLIEPVSNTIDLSDEKSVLISGSNMSGKTTFIRTIGINAILAQTIHTALARKFVLPRIRVHSAIRIADNLLDDKSYYLEEVLAIKELLTESEAEAQNLFLLDELFKGTNTLERISIAKAVLLYLHRQQNLVFAATHDLELTEYLHESFHYFHFTEIIEDGSLSFDYLLKEGKLTNTNAIRLLEINDYPAAVIQEARAVSEQINKTTQ